MHRLRGFPRKKRIHSFIILYHARSIACHNHDILPRCDIHVSIMTTRACDTVTRAVCTCKHIWDGVVRSPQRCSCVLGLTVHPEQIVKGMEESSLIGIGTDRERKRSFVEGGWGILIRQPHRPIGGYERSLKRMRVFA
jgi:hypothetical protein